MSSPTPRPVRPASRFSPRPEGFDPSAQPVALRSEEVRAEFITKTYLHLFGAILAFTLLETAYFKTGLALPIAQALLSTSWLVVLGGFIVVSWLASQGRDVVHIDVEDALLSQLDVVERNLLRDFSSRCGEHVRVTVAHVSTGLQPTRELGVEDQQHALSIGRQDERAGREVTGREVIARE